MNPSFEISPIILAQIAEIMRLLGRYEVQPNLVVKPHLRKENRIRTIRDSLAIEGNSLTIDQVTAILDGKRVAGTAREILEVQNAAGVYETLASLSPYNIKHFLKAHRLMMKGLIGSAGRFRKGSVGVLNGTKVAHLAPPASRVSSLIEDLFSFVQKDESTHPIIKSSVFHYEVEFIHPFDDGNGRMGRLWQHALLIDFHPVFAILPVESMVKKNQQEYYQALAASDHSGQSTAFLEFGLRTILETLKEQLPALAPKRLTSTERLQIAQEQLKSNWFTRKDYLKLFSDISTATASRDLKSGVDSNQLEKKGDRALTRYRFR
jgi:cell filamentation protein, protein adenylyltransferase